MDFDPKDLEIVCGDPVAANWCENLHNKVLIKHKPTGISVEASSERSQYANKELALKELANLLSQIGF